MRRLSDAVSALRKGSTRVVRNQVWYFLDNPNDLHQLQRLRGLQPPPDPMRAPYVTYTVGDSFAPVPNRYIASLEAAIAAELPQEYKIILSKFGPIHLPGEKALAFIDPSAICDHLGPFGGRPWDTPVVPIAYYDADPNPLGFLREGGRFLSRVYSLDVCWHSLETSATPREESVTSLIIQTLALPERDHGPSLQV